MNKSLQVVMDRQSRKTVIITSIEWHLGKPEA
jgi:hypothetical protein